MRLLPFALFLGAALVASLPKLRPQEAAVTSTFTIIRTGQLARHNQVHDHLRRTLGWGENVQLLPGHVKATPDTLHYADLERNGLREIRVSRAGQTIERRTFRAVQS